MKDPHRTHCNECYETNGHCMVGFDEQMPDTVYEGCYIVKKQLKIDGLLDIINTMKSKVLDSLDAVEIELAVEELDSI